MNNAQEFLSSLASQDSATVYESLAAAANENEVSEDQDWDNEMSTWTFEDGSAIVMQNNDVKVVDSLDDLLSEISDQDAE